MSRYEVDKVLRQFVLDRSQRQRFLEDPAALLEGRDLSDGERQALLQRDYATLYALGTHPMLLMRWAQRLHPGDFFAFVSEYTQAIKPHGRPDFST